MNSQRYAHVLPHSGQSKTNTARMAQATATALVLVCCFFYSAVGAIPELGQILEGFGTDEQLVGNAFRELRQPDPVNAAGLPLLTTSILNIAPSSVFAAPMYLGESAMQAAVNACTQLSATYVVDAPGAAGRCLE